MIERQREREIQKEGDKEKNVNTFVLKHCSRLEAKNSSMYRRTSEQRREIKSSLFQKHGRGLDRVPSRTCIIACLNQLRYRVCVCERERERESKRENERESECACVRKRERIKIKRKKIKANANIYNQVLLYFIKKSLSKNITFL